MTSREQQRAETRQRIVAAAVLAFAERGFRGASTREIALRADANQGLITYHFRTKEALWRAAADRLFGELRSRFVQRLSALAGDDPRASAREAIREYVRFAAEHPELFRFMLEAGKSPDDRMQWLVDTHLRPLYERFQRFGQSFGAGFDESLVPHLYYAMAGAGSVIFAVSPECRRLTGLDPGTKRAIEIHADLVARLLVP